MAKSEINLYRTELTPERNALIEDIGIYLTDNCFITYNSMQVQYQKIALNMAITLAIDQETVGNQSLGNYCDIFQDNRHYYFFITNVEWVSSKAVRISLSMDTINTFAKDLEFTDKTSIQREHENRLAQYGNKSTEPGIKHMYRLIDDQPENIILPKDKKSSSQIKDNVCDFDWYLIYHTKDGLTPDNTRDNPIQCDLIAEQPLVIEKAQSGQSEYVWNTSQLQEGVYYYLDSITNTDIAFEGAGLSYNWKQADQGNNYRIFVFYRTTDNPSHTDAIKMEIWKYTKSNGAINRDQGAPTGFNASDTVKFTKAKLIKYSENKYETSFTDVLNIYNKLYIEAGDIASITTRAIKDIDKTDSKLMKILRLPYCPVEVTKNSDGEYIFPDDWKYEDGVMRLQTKNLSKEFENEIRKDNITGDLTCSETVTPYNEKNIHYESKNVK